MTLTTEQYTELLKAMQGQQSALASELDGLLCAAYSLMCEGLDADDDYSSAEALCDCSSRIRDIADNVLCGEEA